jgi:glycosyltransferase involved in cell wall biosynthesis
MTEQNVEHPPIGAVAIGRNEGERLIRCLKSLKAQLPDSVPIVYVDSGSTDGSIEAAQALDVKVIELDMSVPFTMARGRNAGLNYLLQHYPNLEFVQFIDGDCELLPGWIDQAVAAIQQCDRTAVVCGRRRERYPEASPYNQLADLEWDTPIGEVRACGGDALMRLSALKEVQGYNPALIGGEEPEMCLRMRHKGWKVQRIDAEMTFHDAAIHHFSQWWKRSVRAGWAISACRALHGHTAEQYKVKEERSGWLWGLMIPITAIATALPTQGVSLLLLLIYPLLGWKVYRYRRQLGDSAANARLFAFFCILSKFPQMVGQLKYWLTRWRGAQATLIEYKGTPVPKVEN